MDEYCYRCDSYHAPQGTGSCPENFVGKRTYYRKVDMAHAQPTIDVTVNEALLARIAELEALLPKLRREHTVCEDGWYSCPKSGDCRDDRKGNLCDCGADGHNRLIEQALRGE